MTDKPKVVITRRGYWRRQWFPTSGEHKLVWIAPQWTVETNVQTSKQTQPKK